MPYEQDENGHEDADMFPWLSDEDLEAMGDKILGNYDDNNRLSDGPAVDRPRDTTDGYRRGIQE